MKSIQLLAWGEEEGALELRARDFHPNWMSAVTVLDDDTYMGGWRGMACFIVLWGLCEGCGVCVCLGRHAFSSINVCDEVWRGAVGWLGGRHMPHLPHLRRPLLSCRRREQLQPVHGEAQRRRSHRRGAQPAGGGWAGGRAVVVAGLCA